MTNDAEKEIAAMNALIEEVRLSLREAVRVEALASAPAERERAAIERRIAPALLTLALLDARLGPIPGVLKVRSLVLPPDAELQRDAQGAWGLKEINWVPLHRTSSFLSAENVLRAALANWTDTLGTTYHAVAGFLACRDIKGVDFSHFARNEVLRRMSVNGLRGFIADPVGTLETLGFEDADHDKAEALIYYAGRVGGVYASQSDPENSRTAVHDWAELSSLNLDSLRLLLVGKAQFDQPDVRGWTPLHLAARGLLRHFDYGPRSSDEDVQASLDAVKALLVAGADPTRITDDGFHFVNALTTAIVRSDEIGSGLTQGMRELAEVLGLPASPAADIP